MQASAMNFKNLALALVIAVPFAAQAQVTPNGSMWSPNSNMPLAMPAWTVYATGTSATATIEGFDFHGGPGYTNNQLYVGTSLSNLQLIGTNYQFGNSVTLNGLHAGEQIIVSMISQEGWQCYTGSNAVLNPDGQNHSNLYNNANGANVDFEDLLGHPVSGPDWNYGDAHVAVSGAQAVPEPAPIVALGLGVVGLFFRRK